MRLPDQLTPDLSPVAADSGVAATRAAVPIAGFRMALIEVSSVNGCRSPNRHDLRLET